MLDFIFQSPVASLGLILMFSSLYFQVKYLKFKKGSLEISANLVNSQKKFFFFITEVQFEFQEKERRGQIFSFKNLTHKDWPMQIFLNPKYLDNSDSSVVITPLLKKLGLYFSELPLISAKHQKLTVFHMGILGIGFLLSLVA